MKTESIKLRVFFEGVHVPKVSTISIQTQNSEQAQASISFPAVPGFEIEELKRARVHVYWSDIDLRQQRGDNDWPLLFEGEITGDEASKTISSRDFSVSCSGHYTYWEQVQLYFYDDSQAAIHKVPWTQDMALALGNEKFKMDVAVPGISVVSTMIMNMQKGLAEGQEYHSIVKRVFAECLDVNHFFRLQNQVLKLSSRFASAVDKNLDVLIAQETFLQLVDNDAMSHDGEITMMELLKKILAGFRYQILNNSQPVLVTKNRDAKKTVSQKEFDANTVYSQLEAYLADSGVSQPLTNAIVDELEPTTSDTVIDLKVEKILIELQLTEDTVARQGFTDKLRASRDTLADLDNPDVQGSGLNIQGDDLVSQYLLLPETRFTLPPTCNVIFPSHQTELSMRRDFLQEPTRAIGVPQQVAGLPFPFYMAPVTMLQAKIPERVVTPMASEGFCPPVSPPYTISSHYGWRTDPIASRRVLSPDGRRFHHGIDIARPAGTSKEAFVGRDVYAFDAGFVSVAGWQDPRNEKAGYGLRVFIDHGNGMQTRYGHLASITVAVGEAVTRGQKIGGVGNTGASTGPHLHFEVRVGSQTKDPEPLIAQAQISAPAPTAETQGMSVPPQTLQTQAQTTNENKFLDYVFLTPEEENVGIIPYIDQGVTRAYAFMAIAGKDKESVGNHFRQMLESEFWWQRYSRRSINTLNLPFSPQLIAGFPALVVDRVRSIIGLVTSVLHTIAVGGGQGVASTSVQLQAPRYWDEGDPYFWRGGEAKFKPTTWNNAQRELPDGDYAHFPAYYLLSLVATNSLPKEKAGVWTSDKVQSTQPLTRDIDKFYTDILGPGVKAIAYQYAERTTTTTNSTVAYNAAIAGRDGAEAPNTIVGHYYDLVRRDPELAETFANNYTRRLGASEQEIMVKVLGSETRDGGLSYQGPAFRSAFQDKVKALNLRLGSEPAFRG